MKRIVRNENRLSWFVMRCHDAEKIEAYIDEYNADELVAPDDKVEDLFIPALAIRRRVIQRSTIDDMDFRDTRRRADEDVKSNEMRSTLRRFVFLYARPSAFDRLENHLPMLYWNTGHTRLSHYCDGKGNPITVSAERMNIFISGCLEFMEKFEIRTKDAQISEGIKVTVREGAFKDFEAEVYDVRYKANGIRFSIAINFFANDRYIHIHDCRPEDVLLRDEDSPVFSADFIDRIQSSLLAILRRQVHKKETDKSRQEDKSRLQRLYYLRHAMIDDELTAVQLDALMSICASLLKNAAEKSKYNRIIKQHIKVFREREVCRDQQTALAYLLTALYISTKDARYRTELKPLVLGTLSDHTALRNFLSLIR